MKFIDRNNQAWLLDGDVSIQYQLHRDLLGSNKPELQERILNEGWGKAFMSKRNTHGHWGQKFYQPKWISSHYTLLDLRHLNPVRDNPVIKETINNIVYNEKGIDGGVNPSGSVRYSDVCINGMFLNYATYFGIEEKLIEPIIDYIIRQHMKDGGFNCALNRRGARHSSMHSTISLLEGIREYLYNGYKYRSDELESCEMAAREFLLKHKLYLSDRTGEIIKKDFIRLSYPSRWRYDILRALDYFRYAHAPFDERLIPALEVLLKKRRKDGRWNVQAKYPGQVHFEMEKAGKASRWNTLRALRVLQTYDIR
ncbi:MAG: hypothetical protein HKN67_12825 [Saprospiraceae bacterium]|nr:hypothetical protein [Saprospiraceae bacterium]